ncbi:MAG: GNAT family N-acetyltransferase, partial [Deltaproteobacteria bacterium]|nr:GNAT family N-acetyltransferase [Deltaproteobacteria bacterium]
GRDDSGIKAFFASRRREKKALPIVPAEDKTILFNEIEKLSPQRKLLEGQEFTVYYARASEIPHVLREIGRLREITFREVAEGTGTAIDLDSFDNYYYHLFIWSNEKHEVVGAYRIGKTDVILRKFGKRGLYTSTLFDYHDSLLEQISPALEMGRSFIRKEYQRSYTALLLLWRGIGQFVVNNPKYNRLFGPVSINSEYESISRRLIITFLRSNNYMPELAKLIKARNPMKMRPVRGLDKDLTNRVVSSLEDINDLLAEIESKQKAVPVLLRQYLKLGGKLLAFNVDPNFGNVLDGLLLVDLLETDEKLLERYVGKPGAKTFFEYHKEHRHQRRTGIIQATDDHE